MNPIIIIPARLASSRLPRKPLALIAGKPMIVHVLERGLEADIGPVVVACDDTEIADLVRQAGGEVCLTDSNLPSGSDRVFAALQSYDSLGKHDVVINLQGDSPTTGASVIRTALKGLKNTPFDISTVAVASNNPDESQNPHVCKIALAGSTDQEIRQALYFSRAPIPAGSDIFYLHIGLYAYQRTALEKFVHHAPTSLEKSENLEQLRALEFGLKVGVSLVDAIPQEVNTPEDLETIQHFFPLKTS